MPKIRILEDRVANQIAAGEVVERPASVAKELIENSIDAQATKIEIEFRNGGKSYLRVEDNGCGMNSDQALLSLERHATSKIRKASDLNEIRSFGFRGEALPSIASVSRFTMRTRSSSRDEGNELLINGGKMVHVKECGMPEGTRVEVAHLFNSVPGRRKFLKTENTEATHLIHLTKLYALAHSQISFSLMEGSRTLFRSPACERVEDRVREIFGKGLAEALTPISANSQGIELDGLVGKPGYSRSTRKEMIFFVNNRPVESKTISYSVLEAYHTFSPKGRFPPAILFVSMDPELIDVNVHPSKREIRFRNESQVRSFLVESLLSHNRDFSGVVEKGFDKPDLEMDPIAGKMVPKVDLGASETYKLDQSVTGLKTVSADSMFSKTTPSTSGDSFNFLDNPGKIAGKREEINSDWRFLNLSKGVFAIFITPQGIVYLHAKAAYERVRFEQLENALQANDSCASQKLLLSEALELDGIDRANLEASLKDLRKLGFIIEEFGRNFYRLDGCPAWLEPDEARLFVEDFLEIAREEGGRPQINQFAKDALIRQTSSPIEKKGSFSGEEVIRLANQLMKCKNPYTCPNGKPTFFETPYRDFETRFKREL